MNQSLPLGIRQGAGSEMCETLAHAETPSCRLTGLARYVPIESLKHSPSGRLSLPVGFNRLAFSYNSKPQLPPTTRIAIGRSSSHQGRIEPSAGLDNPHTFEGSSSHKRLEGLINSDKADYLVPSAFVDSVVKPKGNTRQEVVRLREVSRDTPIHYPRPQGSELATLTHSPLASHVAIKLVGVIHNLARRDRGLPWSFNHMTTTHAPKPRGWDGLALTPSNSLVRLNGTREPTFIL